MPTPRQEKLADAIIENLASDKPKTKKEVLVSVGYPLSTAEKGTAQVMEQQGVQEALEARGFTIENAKKVVTEIMLDPEQDASARLKATDQTFKVHGAYAAEKIITLDVTPKEEQKPEVTALIDEYEEKLKKMLDAPSG